MIDPQLGVQVVAGVLPGPDGQPWVVVQIHYGGTARGLMLPADLAETLGPAITVRVAEAVAADRRAAVPDARHGSL